MAFSTLGKVGPVTPSGNSIVPTSVTVRVAGTVTSATVYADKFGTPLANPLPVGVGLGVPGVDTSGNVTYFVNLNVNPTTDWWVNGSYLVPGIEAIPDVADLDPGSVQANLADYQLPFG